MTAHPYGEAEPEPVFGGAKPLAAGSPTPSPVVTAQRVMYLQAFLLMIGMAYLLDRMALATSLGIAVPAMILPAALVVVAVMLGRLRFRPGAVALQLLLIFPFLVTGLSATVASPLLAMRGGSLPEMLGWFLIYSVPLILRTTLGGAAWALTVLPATSLAVIVLLFVPASHQAFSTRSEARERFHDDRNDEIDLD